jgi:hypothetical protein
MNRQEEMTVLEALQKFPELAAEVVRFGSMDSRDIRTANHAIAVTIP